MFEIKKDENSNSSMMKVSEVAEFLRLSKAKIYRMANSGQLPSIRFGKTWRFNKKILDDWIYHETKGGGGKITFG